MTVFYGWLKLATRGERLLDSCQSIRILKEIVSLLLIPRAE